MATPFLTGRDLTVSFGGKPLFQNLTFHLFKGDRVCLVGRNGSGKSTLLKLIGKVIEPDRGNFFLEPGVSVAYLPQDAVLPSHQTPLEYLMRLGTEQYIAESYLDKLGMLQDKKMEVFSGGEKRRVSLAEVLVKEPDILLLDEPTNHLDIPIIEWLEGVMTSFQGAIIMISHDRSFLEKTSNRTLWLDRGMLHAHKKGYADFERWSEEILAEEERQMEKLNTKLRLEQDWLLFGVTARRKRNQGRLRKLHAMRQQRQEREQNKHGTFKLTALSGDGGSKLVVEAKNISKSFGDQCLIRNFSSRILRGDRIGVIGANGTGKTTLLKMLVGALPPDSGEVRQGANIDLVYFDQMRDTLDPEKTLWQNLCPEGGDQVLIGGQLRHVVAYLKDFLFEERQIRGLTRILSGGEKNRLALAKALTQQSNVLVLDEPTNDLDMDTLDLLIDMLLDYEGTLMVVSHDRDFLNKVTTSIIAVEGQGVVEEYVGGYDDYIAQRKLPFFEKVKTPPKPNEKEHEKKKSSTSNPSKKLSYNDKRLLESLPEKISALESQVSTAEEKLANPDFYIHHPQEFKMLSENLGKLQRDLAEAEEKWLELSIEE